MSSVSIEYDYPFASELISESSKRNLRLATCGGADKNPHFFAGRLVNPKEIADLMLALSLISRTRFFSPGELRNRMIAAADPVVTSDGKRLRMEVFSVCCGAYARLDLHDSALDGDWIGKGTTNVDFNQPMRAALATVMNSDDVALRVGIDRVEIEHGEHRVVERKVRLPARWLKGFVEVQAYQSVLKPATEIASLELLKVIRSLPQQNIMQAGTVTYLVPSGKSMRLSQRATPDGIPVGAISRLKILEPILRYAKTVRLYSGADAICAFELILSNGSFFFVSSSNAARGFSGEGQALSSLAQQSSADALARVKSALVWQDKISLSELSDQLGLDAATVHGALQVLGTRGLVGYDLAASAFFHREIPFDLSLIEALHPRMKKARQLIEEKSVRVVSTKNGSTEAYVKGSTAEHLVQTTLDGARCTCEWFAANQGARGPCSHILAVEILSQEEETR
jgi:hypothetical protein